MFVRLACSALFAIAVVPAMIMAVPAVAESPEKSYLFGERNFRHACRPPLKFASGACVRRCPAGFQDMGGYCRYRSMRR